MLRFIPIIPKSKDRPRMGCGHAYTPKKTREYEKRIAEETADIHVSGPVSLKLGFVMPIPKSWSKRKQTEMCGKPHTSVPDTDNLIKAVMDGMSQCWEDDRKVFSVLGVKRYGDIPGVLIEIEEGEQ